MWIREYRSEIIKYLRTPENYDPESVRKFVVYENALRRRNYIVAEYPGHKIFHAPKEKKELLSKYTTEVIKYETEIMGTPIYDYLKKNFEGSGTFPVYVNNDRERFSSSADGTNAGWYQNSKGDLFHYDGTIWDNVPEERIQQLEYLG